MGAWGEKAFENDSALDWLGELESEGVDALRDLLARVADTDEEELLDVDEGAAAIAAAEVVAAARGRGRDRVKPALSWLAANGSDVLAEDLALAARAVERVVGSNSELRDLWEDGDPDGAWHADVRTLLTLVGSTARIRAPQRGRETPDETEKQVLLTFLSARGLQPTNEQLARVLASDSAAQVRGWLSRALLATSVEAVLDE